MALFDKIKQKFLETSSRLVFTRIEDVDWMSQVVHGTTMDEVVVDEATIQGSATIVAAVRIIAEDLAQLPTHVFFKENGNRYQDPNHPVSRLLKRPNQFQTAFKFQRALFSMALVFGRACVKIHRDGNNRPIELELLHPNNIDDVVFERERYWKHVYGYDPNDYEILNDSDIISIDFYSSDGIHSMSLVQLCANAIGISMQAEHFQQYFYKNGMWPSFIVQYPIGANPDNIKNEMAKLRKLKGVSKAGGMLPMAAGFEVKPMDYDLGKNQNLETRKFQIAEISRVTRIPLHKLADLENATFSNIEHQSIDYVKHTLAPWAIQYEQDVDRKLFSLREQDKYYIKKIFQGFLRGDTKTRTEYYSTMVMIGAMSPNEVRVLEDMNAREGGDQFLSLANYLTDEQRKALIQKTLSDADKE